MVFSSKQFGIKFLVVAYLSICLTETAQPSMGSVSVPKYLKNISNWLTKRSFTLLSNKRLFFPPGSKITLNPIFEVPVLDPVMFGISSTFKMSLPFTVDLDKHSFMNNFLNNRNGYFKLLSLKELQNLNRHKRSIHQDYVVDNSTHTTSANICTRLSSERVAIFHKLETLIDSYGLGMQTMKGKSCLLRALCEIHEYPMVEGYGILGELITILFSVDRFSETCEKESSALSPYMKAERYGRTGRCHKYYESCERSLFVPNN